MSFIYEKLTEDRKKDFPELEGKYPNGWYVDLDNNICIWGGLAAGHWMPICEGDYRWMFHLGVNHEWFDFVLEPGLGSKKFEENPYVIKWDKVISIQYHSKNSIIYKENNLIEYLKVALTAWGAGHSANKYILRSVVEFNF
ncbi:hypothetical protein [Acinetobacter sp. NS-4]|uniref:hypothetical protein n=1 Tax=Acinetobacter sp. NS-4 TaxID=3127956 RepID=UPI00307E92A8